MSPMIIAGKIMRGKRGKTRISQVTCPFGLIFYRLKKWHISRDWLGYVTRANNQGFPPSYHQNQRISIKRAPVRLRSFPELRKAFTCLRMPLNLRANFERP